VGPGISTDEVHGGKGMEILRTLASSTKISIEKANKKTCHLPIRHIYSHAQIPNCCFSGVIFDTSGFPMTCQKSHLGVAHARS
jgi:hypothetical protein